MGILFGTGQYPTLLDVSRSIDPSGKTAEIAELLQQSNPALLDIPYFEANMPNGEQSSIRTGLPTAIFRKWYQGVPTSKSTYANVMDATAALAARSEIDKKVADYNGNTLSFRMIEALGHIEAMNQKAATALFYGDVTKTPEQFNGLAPRFSSLSAGNKDNIIDAGGQGTDNASIWLTCWGKQSVYGIFPKGSKAGLNHQDLGEIDVLDADGNKFRGYADIWDWEMGLVVKNWQYIVRIANIDMSNLVTEQQAADIVKLMIKAMHKVPNLGIVQTGMQHETQNGAAPILNAVNPVFYCNRTIAEMLDIQSLNKTQYTLKSGSDVYGRPVTFCRGIPIRSCDVLLNTEDRVV